MIKATNRVMVLIKDYVADESGATAIEYGLIAALIGLAIIGGASKIAKENDSVWNSMARDVEKVG